MKQGATTQIIAHETEKQVASNGCLFAIFFLSLIVLSVHLPWTVVASESRYQSIRLTTCSASQETCYEVTAPQMDESSFTALFTFPKAEVRVFDKKDDKMKLRQVVQGEYAYFEPHDGIFVLRNPNGKIGTELLIRFRDNQSRIFN